MKTKKTERQRSINKQIGEQNGQITKRNEKRKGEQL